MPLFNRRTVALACAPALIAGAFLAPSAASAQTVKFKLISKGTLKGTKLSGSFSGTFGKGKATGTATIPKLTSVFHVKGGTLIFKTRDAHLNAEGTAVGTY